MMNDARLCHRPAHHPVAFGESIFEQKKEGLNA